jgi:hypothetical protein
VCKGEGDGDSTPLINRRALESRIVRSAAAAKEAPLFFYNKGGSIVVKKKKKGGSMILPKQLVYKCNKFQRFSCAQQIISGVHFQVKNLHDSKK